MAGDVLEESVYSRMSSLADYVDVGRRRSADQSMRFCLIALLRQHRDRLAEIEIGLLARQDRRYAEVGRAVTGLQSLIDEIVTNDTCADGLWLRRQRLRDEDVALLQMADRALAKEVAHITDVAAEIYDASRENSSVAALVGEIELAAEQIKEKLAQRNEVMRNPLP